MIAELLVTVSRLVNLPTKIFIKLSIKLKHSVVEVVVEIIGKGIKGKSPQFWASSNKNEYVDFMSNTQYAQTGTKYLTGVIRVCDVSRGHFIHIIDPTINICSVMLT